MASRCPGLGPGTAGRFRLAGGSDQEAAITSSGLAGLLPASAVGDAPAVPLLPAPDPAGWVGERIVAAFTGLLRALAEDFLSQLAAPLARYVLHTPDLLAEATLRRYWLVSLAALTVCAGLLVAIAGVAIIPGSSSRLALAAREAVGVRLAGCLLTASVSLPLVALEVELANRLVDAFVTQGFDAGDNPLWRALSQAVTGDAAALGLLVTAAVGVVLLVVLLVLALARWATVWLLVVLAPVAMGFALLPGGAGVARVWWRLQLATVFLPVLNAVLLGTYAAMFTSERSGLVGALSGVAVLALMAKLPAWAAGIAVGLDSGELTHRVRRGGRVAQRVVGVTRDPAAAAAATAVPAAGSSAARSRSGARISGVSHRPVGDRDTRRDTP